MVLVNHTIPSDTSVSEIIITHTGTYCCHLDYSERLAHNQAVPVVIRCGHILHHHKHTHPLRTVINGMNYISVLQLFFSPRKRLNRLTVPFSLVLLLLERGQRKFYPRIQPLSWASAHWGSPCGLLPSSEPLNGKCSTLHPSLNYLQR